MKKITSLLLALIFSLNLTLSLMTPAPAVASIKSTGIEFVGCATGNLSVNAYASSELKKRVDKKIEEFKKNTEKFLKKHLGSLLKKLGLLGKAGGAAIGGKVPVEDEAAKKSIDTFSSSWSDKYTRKDIIARCLARAIMNGMTNKTLQIARTGGRDGGPTHIKNWTNFQTAAQYRGENIFRAQLSTTKLCDYLAEDVKKSFGVDPKKKTPLTGQNTRSDSLEPFNLRAKCTLPPGFTIDKLNADFAGNGGWEAFARALEPQNNAWGLATLSQDEIAKQRSLAVAADNNQALANNGLLGISGRGKNDSCAVKGPAGDCIIYKDIKTPGSYLSSNIAATVNAEFTWLTSSQGLGTIITNATEVLLNRLLDFNSSDEGKYRWADENDPESGLTPEEEAELETPLPPAEVLAPADSLLLHPSQASVVASVKADLVAQGVDISGECGAFKITKGAAWRLKDSGAGLLSKPTGNNCEGYAVDIIAFPDGYIYDVVGDSGAGNIPGWSPAPCGTDGTCADRYRPAVDPGSTP